MDESIRVRVLGREFALRARPEDVELTRDIAAYVNAKMQAFKKAHPDQPEITTAIITALAIAEELYTSWEEQDNLQAALEAERAGLASELEALAMRLDEAVAPPGDAPAPPEEKAAAVQHEVNGTGA